MNEDKRWMNDEWGREERRKDTESLMSAREKGWRRETEREVKRQEIRNRLIIKVYLLKIKNE